MTIYLKKNIKPVTFFLALTLLGSASLFANTNTSNNAEHLALTEPKQPLIKNFFNITPEQKLLSTNAGSLTITGAGNIRFLQAFFYSDVACSTVLGGASLIDNGAGFPFSSAELVKLDTSSAYQLANNQGITTGNIACMKLFLDGSNDSSDGVACQSFTDIACSGTSCTSNQTKAVTWAASPTACAVRYAYAVNSGTGSLLKCTINASNGLFANCVTTATGFNSPVGVMINNYHAYITSYLDSSVFECSVSSSDGGLSNCATTGSGFVRPTGIVINNNYAYISELDSGTVLQCTVSTSDGTLSSCTSTGSGFVRPTGIVINNNYAYIANSNDTVSKCTVSTSDGTLSSCTSTGSNFARPYGITMNNGYAYVTNFTSNNNTVTKCTVSSSDGALSSCASTGNGFKRPTGVTINNGYAYISNFNNNTISRCAVSSANGTFSSCTTTGSGFSSPILSYVY